MKRTFAITAVAALAAAGIMTATSPAGAQPPRPDPSVAATSAADQHVSRHAADLKVGPADRLVRAQTQPGTDGLQYVAYHRLYGDLPVFGGDVVVMTDAEGDVLSTSVTQKQVIDVPSRPRVDAERAKATSRAQLPTVSTVSEPRLAVHAIDRPVLAWETVVEGQTSTNTPSKLHVFVDAITGAVTDSYDEVKAGQGNGYYNGQVTISTSQTSGGYSMTDPNRPGIRCGGQNGSAYTGPDDVWGNGSGTNLETACVDALYAVQKQWDMLGQWLNRNGINGNGGGFPARVGLNQVNAYWNGSYTNFGRSQDGQRQVTPIDVVAHEYGHAIFQTTPGGAGSGNENGGLNEGTGDIFGAVVEHYVNNPNDPPDYLVGEEVNLVGNGPIRNMYNPSALGDPNCYSSAIPNTEVHAAAGPLNHWFYLVAEGSNPGGGKPNSPICSGGPASVTGSGIQTAAKVYYNAMLQKTSGWRYVNVRVATLNSAKALDATCVLFNRVKDAWNAVSVPQQSGEPTCTSTPGNDFSVSVSPASGTVDPGGSTTATVATATTNGNPQSVALSASGLPAGATATFNPATVTSGGSSTMTIATSASTPGGTYTVTINGTGTVTRSATYTLTVRGGTPGSCQGYESNYGGSLTSGQSVYEPDSGSFQTTASGTFRACLDGPNGTDYDLYLQKLNGSTWTTVAQGISANPDEQFTYNGTAGTYRYRVHAYSGSGAYSLGYDTP